MTNGTLKELNTLEEWIKGFVKEHTEYTYKRYDKETLSHPNWHQIVVYKNHKQIFDAVCHFGSYGYDLGLLEIMGDIVTNEDDGVEGYLTSQEVINKFLCWVNGDEV